MSGQSTGLLLVVRAKGAKGFFYEVENPTVLPRCGEIVRFDDKPGVVESVTWDVRAEPMPTVTAECVPASASAPEGRDA